MRIAAVVGLALLVVIGWPRSQASAVQEAEKITLKLNLKQGDKRSVAHTMDMDSKVSVGDMNIEMKISTSMYVTVTVQEVGQDGMHTMQFTYDRIRFKMAGPMELEFDSADKEKNGGPIGQIFGALVGQSITTKMTSAGVVKEVTGFEKLAEKLGVPKEQLAQQQDQFAQMMAALPDKPVGIGDSWTGTIKFAPFGGQATAMTTRYTLVDRKNGEAIVKSESTLKADGGLNGMVKGTMRIDETTGWTNGGEMVMELKGEIGGASMNITGKGTFGPAKGK